LVIAEVFVSGGIAGAAGAVLLVAGGLLLVDRMDPRWFSDQPLAIPARLLVPSALLVAGGATFVFSKVRRARALPQKLGPETLVGHRAVTLGRVDQRGGEVMAQGARWAAKSRAPIDSGHTVVIRHLDGLTLEVSESPS
jgi:membrane-bound serine protease (ClpP class)